MLDDDLHQCEQNREEDEPRSFQQEPLRVSFLLAGWPVDFPARMLPHLLLRLRVRRQSEQEESHAEILSGDEGVTARRGRRMGQEADDVCHGEEMEKHEKAQEEN